MAKQVVEELTRQHVPSECLPLDEYDVTQLPHERCVVFVVSTTGEGVVPDNMRSFWRFLLRKDLPPGSLGAVRHACFGLGDSSYPKFNFAAKRLHRRLLQLGSTALLELGLADDQDDLGIDQALAPWLEALRARLLELWPMAEGRVPIPRSQSLPPRYRHLTQPLPDVLAVLGSQPLERLGGASPPKVGQYACVPRGAVGRTLHTRGCGDVCRFRHATAGLAQVVLPQGRSHALAAVARGLGALGRTTPHERHDAIGVLAGSLQAPIHLVRSPCILECHLQCVAASEPIVVVLVTFRRRDICHQPTRACTRSLQLVLLQGDPHGAVPVRGGFVSLAHPDSCCNISNAPRGASTGDPQLLVPQQ